MSERSRRDAAAASPRDATSRSIPHGSSGGRRAGAPSSGTAALRTGRDVLASGMAHRPVDVICAGMYRACSTWQYEVAAHLVEHHRRGSRLGYLMPGQYAGPDGRTATEGGSTSSTVPGWRVFKSHDGHGCFAAAIAQGRAVAIYAYRDVRDVVFSLMHKRGWTFEQLLRQGMIHQVLANDRFWTRQPGVLIQRYDDLLADPVGGVLGLARHLGIALADGEAAEIAAAYSLESNRARTEALRRRLELAGLDLSQAANSQICDPSTLLHWNHVRNGGSGSWIAHATPRQRVILARLCRRWLQARGYPLHPAGAEAGAAAESHRDWRDVLRIEADLAVARLNYLVRAASLRYPRLARMAKRLLGSPTEGQAGATVWSESKRGSPMDLDSSAN